MHEDEITPRVNSFQIDASHCGEAFFVTDFISYQCIIAPLVIYLFEVDLLSSERSQSFSIIPQNTCRFSWHAHCLNRAEFAKL